MHTYIDFAGLKVGRMTHTIWVTWVTFWITFLVGLVGLICKLNYLNVIRFLIDHMFFSMKPAYYLQLFEACGVQKFHSQEFCM